MATYHWVPEPERINAPTLATTRRLENGKGDERFISAMLDLSPTSKGKKNPWRVALSIAAHVVLLGAAIIAPIYFANDALNLTQMTRTFLVAPPPPAPPPPPVQTIAKVAPVRAIIPAALVAPKVVPRNIEVAKDEPPAEAAPDVSAGVPGGVPGGELGGVLNGVGTAAPAPPPKPPAVVRVGGNVKAPRLVSKVDPVYPPIAKSSHTQGTVRIEAVIDTQGNVVRAHALDGPGLLIPAALNAVDKWKYEPTYLNGQAVSVAMQVTVDFQLGAASAGF
jgi:periplasmic protein TonB